MKAARVAGYKEIGNRISPVGLIDWNENFFHFFSVYILQPNLSGGSGISTLVSLVASAS
jgi:hypothetical protein